MSGDQVGKRMQMPRPDAWDTQPVELEQFVSLHTRNVARSRVATVRNVRECL